jgi:hypothetical protein
VSHFSALMCLSRSSRFSAVRRKRRACGVLSRTPNIPPLVYQLTKVPYSRSVVTIRQPFCAGHSSSLTRFMHVPFPPNGGKCHRSFHLHIYNSRNGLRQDVLRSDNRCASGPPGHRRGSAGSNRTASCDTSTSYVLHGAHAEVEASSQRHLQPVVMQT